MGIKGGEEDATASMLPFYLAGTTSGDPWALWQ